MADRSFAGGITRVLVHGFDIPDLPNSPWPSYHAFPQPVSFAEAWSPNSPMLPAMKGLADYWARAAVALQNGRPAMDLAVYRNDFSTYSDKAVPSGLDGASLQVRGFTWDLIDPQTLVDQGAVRGGRLLPDGPAYKALVVHLDARSSGDAEGPRR